MYAIRRLALRHFWLAACILGLALVARALVPSGYMPNARTLTLELCSGVAEHQSIEIKIPAKDAGKAAKAGQPCAFTALGLDALSAASPALIAAAILVAMALALRSVPPLALRRPAHLRPPLRGPPIA